MLALSQPTTEDGWRAHLALAFQRRGPRTVLKRCLHNGPLRVQRAFYPEPDGACHVYLLHPPGGVVGGDRLELDAQLGSDSQVLLTTPSAGKFYRSNGHFAQQTNKLIVQANAVLEWLPQETIVFDGARLTTTTQVDLHDDARAIGWEIICLGRPAAAESFTQGVCRQGLELYRTERPLLIEHNDWRGGSEALAAPWGLNKQPICGTLFATVNDETLLTRLRETIRALPPAQFAVTQLRELLLCRYLGPSSAEARDIFTHAWTFIRPHLLQKPACPPRVWAV